MESSLFPCKYYSVHLSVSALLYIEPQNGQVAFYGTFVYAFNDASSRKDLWRNLVQIHVMQNAWVWMGDFNSVLNVEDRLGAHLRATEFLDFKSCVDQCRMERGYEGH